MNTTDVLVGIAVVAGLLVFVCGFVLGRVTR